MEAFKTCLDDSSCHICGYHYSKPVSTQFRNTNVRKVSTILHILTNLVSLNVYGVNLSLGTILEDLTRFVPIFVEYRSPHEIDPIWHSFSVFNHRPTNIVFTTVFDVIVFNEYSSYKGIKWPDVAFRGYPSPKINLKLHQTCSNQ